MFRRSRTSEKSKGGNANCGEDVDMQADFYSFPTSGQSILDLKNVDLDPLTEALRENSMLDIQGFVTFNQENNIVCSCIISNKNFLDL